MIILVLAFATIALATIGYMRIEDRDLGLLDALYESFKIFGFGGSVPASPPLELNIARFLGPLTVGYATIRALVALSREQLDLTRIRLLSRDHVIIGGLGAVGRRLAVSFHESGASVLAVESDPNNPAISSCRQLGISVVIGSATAPEILEMVRADRARYLFACLPEDGQNIELVETVARLPNRPVDGNLTAFARVEDRALWQFMKGPAMSMAADRGFRLELFNVDETAARMLVELNRPFSEQIPPERAKVLVCGGGPLTESLIVQLARTWRIEGPRGLKLPVAVAAPEAEAHRAFIEARYPRLTESLALEWATAALGPGEALPGVEVDDELTVYVSAAEEAVGLAVAISLRNRTSNARVAPLVLVVADEESGVSRALVSVRELGVGISVFGTLTRALVPDLVVRGTTEVIAKARHQGYLDAQHRLGQRLDDNPSLVPWEDLPTSLKQSNRSFADGIGPKIAAIDCVVVPDYLADPREPRFEFTAAELGRLAHDEHDRWMRDLIADGWSSGPVKDAEAKVHPMLVEWDRLSESEREKDRDAVREIPAALARAGFQITRERVAEHDAVDLTPPDSVD